MEKTVPLQLQLQNKLNQRAENKKTGQNLISKPSFKNSQSYMGTDKPYINKVRPSSFQKFKKLGNQFKNFKVSRETSVSPLMKNLRNFTVHADYSDVRSGIKIESIRSESTASGMSKYTENKKVIKHFALSVKPVDEQENRKT